VGQTIVEKVAQAHLTEGPDRPLRAGDFASLRPAHVLTHDNTAPVIKKFRSLGATRFADNRQPVFALDHDIQNTSSDNLRKYQAIESFAREHGIEFFPAGAGIGHQIMMENGFVLPGAFVVASDSHANMYGALGAVGTPVVRTDAAAIWATGEFWWQIPRTVQVRLDGSLPPGSTAKDVIITLCGMYSRGEVLNAAVEFCGPGVGSLSAEQRMTIANMSTEWGALVAWFPVDGITTAYLRNCLSVLRSRGIERIRDEQLAEWSQTPPAPDGNADYAASITLSLDEVVPSVSGPNTVYAMESLAEIERRRIPIQKAYLLSCVNGRLEDLTEAARVLAGHKVAEAVAFYVAPASDQARAQAEQSGAWQTLLDAGAVPLPAGCGPCIGLGSGVLEPGETGISATNRNFKGRMGSRDAQCYLASPAVVAASAIAGYIRGPGSAKVATATRHYEQHPFPARAPESVTILDGFPAEVSGRLVFLPQDDLNTDGIYGKEFTYRDDVGPDLMARVVMQNYDPRFTDLAKAGDVLVAGFNFGCGSSREQAATALAAKGIALVIAGSFSQTFLRNAFNNGFLCVESPAFVEHLYSTLAPRAAPERTIVPGDSVQIAFTTGTISYRGESHFFAPLGRVPQSLIVAGGVERLVAAKLRTEP